MAYYENTHGLEYEDEDEVLKPYDSVASRPPVPDKEELVQGPSSSAPMNPFTPPNPVKDRIAQKFAPPSQPDPVMQQFDSDQAENLEFQGVQNQGNLIGNLARSFAQAAQGVHAPKPNTGLFDAMDAQRSQAMQGRQSAQSQRAKIMQAIEARKTSQNQFQQGFQQRDRIANQSNDTRIAGIDAQKENMRLRRERLDNTIETSANTLFSKETTPYTKALDSSKRLQDVLSQVQSGKLTSASNVAAAMTADMGQLLANSSNTTVSDRQKGEVHALESTANKIKQYATSRPKDTIPKAYLDQFQIELDILKHSILTNYENKMNELKAGTKNPAKQEIFENRFQSQKDSNSEPVAPLTEMKEVEGVKWRKVPGGWEEI